MRALTKAIWQCHFAKLKSRQMHFSAVRQILDPPIFVLIQYISALFNCNVQIHMLIKL